MNATDKFMNEAIIFGGFALRRCDVYTLALDATGDKRAADLFAFKPKAVDMEPITIDEFLAETENA